MDEIDQKRRRGEETTQPATDAEVAATLRQTWHRWLHVNCDAYRRLRAEIADGWRTTALNRRFEESQEFHRHGTAARVGECNYDEADDDARAAASSGCSGGGEGGEALQAAMRKKVLGYAHWCETTLAAAAPDVFVRWSPSIPTRPQFLDIGSAPGGMSRYLHAELRWRGLATSLAPDKGGMPMVYAPEASSVSPAAVVGPVVVSKPSATTKLMALMSMGKKGHATLAPASSSSSGSGGRAAEPQTDFTFVTGDMLIAETERVIFSKIAAGSCAVVIAGAVQDQTQRERQYEIKDSNTKDADDNHNREPEHRAIEAIFRSRLAFSFAQLRLALRAIKPGGTLLLVYGPSDCASLVLLTARVLRLLVPDAKRDVRVLPTMHVEKAPIYVLLTHVLADGSPMLNGASADAADREVLLSAIAAQMCMARSGEEGGWATSVDWASWTMADSSCGESLAAFADAHREELGVFRELLEADLARVWALRAEKLRMTRLAATKKFHA